MLVAAIAAFGIYSLKNLLINAVPDITNNQVQINTVALALSPMEVEKQVTRRLITATLLTLMVLPALYKRFRLAEEGWLYLAVVIDLFSRKIVGWSMGDRINAGLVNDALLMAIWKRKPADYEITQKSA